MRAIIFCCLFLVGTEVSFAKALIKFFPGNQTTMINIVSQDRFGGTDEDVNRLYQDLNVSEQESMLGPGKSLVSEEKDFNLVCSKVRQQCSIVFTRSERLSIKPREGYLSYRLVGPAAAALYAAIKSSGDFYKYESSDGKLLFFASLDRFEWEFKD